MDPVLKRDVTILPLFMDMYFTSWSRVPLWLSVLGSSCQMCSIYISCPHKTAHIASPPRSASGHAQKTWYILLMGFYLIGEKTSET